MNAFSSLLSSLPAAHGGYLGESIALAVAVSWTVCALLSETVSRRLGAHVVNVLRMVLSLLFIGALLWVCTGSPLPPRADATTWGWLLASGFVGYVFGDYCLFNAYLLIGSRFGQLFMTIAPAVSAVAGWLLLGEQLSAQALAGMAVTTTGIAVSILGRGAPDEEDEGRRRRKVRLNLPTRGVLLGIGAGVGQGLGLTLSAVGLHHYAADWAHGAASTAPAAAEHLRWLLPFAATQMRAVAGLPGFLLILFLAGKGAALRLHRRPRLAAHGGHGGVRPLRRGVALAHGHTIHLDGGGDDDHVALARAHPLAGACALRPARDAPRSARCAHQCGGRGALLRVRGWKIKRAIGLRSRC